MNRQTSHAANSANANSKMALLMGTLRIGALSIPPEVLGSALALDFHPPLAVFLPYTGKEDDPAYEQRFFEL